MHVAVFKGRQGFTVEVKAFGFGASTTFIYPTQTWGPHVGFAVITRSDVRYF